MSDKEYKNVTDATLSHYMELFGLDQLNLVDLTASYKRILREHHTDKGGNLDYCQSVTQAYRILKLCMENDRTVPSRLYQKPGPSKAKSKAPQTNHQAYAEQDDTWEQYTKSFKPKQRNPKYHFKPTKFDRAFQKDWQHPEDAEDPINSDIGKARSKPKKYNNGYTYEDDDEFIPNDRQNYSTKNDGEPRVIRGGLELRKPFSGIDLPDNYVNLSQSEIKLCDLTGEQLEKDPTLNELYTLLNTYKNAPSFETLIQRSKTFVYLDWAQSNQSDTTQYQNVEIGQGRHGAVTIILPQFEEDDIVDDRLTEGAIIQLYSVEDAGFNCKATVDTVDWELHKITITFSNKNIGDKLVACGHRCNVSMAPSRFIYRAFIRGLNSVINEKMIDFIYPEPEFEEEYEEFTNITEQRIADSESHQQTFGGLLFNHKQELAIDAIVNNTCGKYPFLLFGPPGTGKTATLVECLHRITKMGKEKRVLVCTPSNMAADVIAKFILERGFIEEKYVFRLNSLSFDYKKRNKSLDSIACIVKEGSNYCFGIPCLRNLQVFRIIITTLTSATYLTMAGGLKGYFSHILIDESAQATEQETYIPIGGLAIPGKTTVALFGDPKQLGAVDRVPVLRDFGYNESMMERLLKLPAYQSDHRLFVMLEQNYRTHAMILRPASRLFYEQKLLAMKADQRLYQLCGWSELPNASFPLIFHSIRGSKEIKSATFSYKNNYEMDLCIDYIKKLIKHDVQPEEIGVISPYKFQGAMVKDLLNYNKLYGVTVNSVEGFQGSERRVIIFLTTRTNTLGFLSCDKRLNTSITRAQQLLIVLGDEDLLGEHRSWNQFIYYVNYHGGFKGSSLLGAPQNGTSSGNQNGTKPKICEAIPPPGFEMPVYDDENCGNDWNDFKAEESPQNYDNDWEEERTENYRDEEYDAAPRRYDYDREPTQNYREEYDAAPHRYGNDWEDEPAEYYREEFGAPSHRYDYDWEEEPTQYYREEFDGAPHRYDNDWEEEQTQNYREEFGAPSHRYDYDRREPTQNYRQRFNAAPNRYDNDWEEEQTQNYREEFDGARHDYNRQPTQNYRDEEFDAAPHRYDREEEHRDFDSLADDLLAKLNGN